MKRVVVTGIGVLSPIGADKTSYLEGLQQGRSGANIITRFDPTLFKTRFACELKNFNAEEFLDKKEARKIDPFACLLYTSRCV